MSLTLCPLALYRFFFTSSLLKALTTQIKAHSLHLQIYYFNNYLQILVILHTASPHLITSKNNSLKNI